MANLKVKNNVYTAVTSAVKDGNVSSADLQRIVQEVNADQKITADEKKLLSNLENHVAFTVSSGSQSTPINPSSLSFPTRAASLTGQTVGRTSGGQPIKLGPFHKAFDSEHEAMKFARSQWGVLNNQDFGLLQNRQGKYEVYELQVPGRLGADSDDLNSYEELRAASFTPPAGTSLTGVYSDKGHFRSESREAAPTRAYAPIQNPMPGDTLPQLRGKVSQAIDRLRDMERTLGAQKDHRGVFSAMYRVITERGLKEMDKMLAAGDKVGAEFEAKLVINFANKFFSAYDNYNAGNLGAVPEVWRSAFDAGRNAESVGYDVGSISEVTGLSMVAHIIHDLPHTLKEIGYKNGGHEEVVFDSFNQSLMEERDRIIGAIAAQFGTTDLEVLEKGFRAGAFLASPILGPVAAQAAEQGAFTGMRTLGKWESQNLNSAQIRQLAMLFSESVRKATPGGN